VSVLELSLACAALLIGLTGAWSPCGFSMVETIGLAGDGTRRWTTIGACATFAPGAVIGGVVTFGLLAALGEGIHGIGGRAAYLIAAAIAVAAAVAEARGLRIAPQIRRQLPEGWRWTMPLPLASALYGLLLGLGFTTFVLSFGVWALGGISLALGDPSAGIVIGAAFGIGRALPVLVVAPAVDTRAGVRCIEMMAERPALYRAFRLGDALTLGVVAVALSATATATAARTEVGNGADPSAAGKSLAFQRPDRAGVLRLRGHVYRLPGRDPALGGKFAAVISDGNRIEILDRFSRQAIRSTSAANAQAVAISRRWLAYLTVHRGRYTLKARRLRRGAHPGKARRIASVKPPAQLGRPTLRGSQLFYTVSKRRVNSIKRRSLASGKRGSILRSRTAELLNPSVLGRHLVYVRVSRGPESPQATHPRALRQALMIKRVGHHGAGRRIYTHGPDRNLWSTALSGRRGFVTLLGHGGPKIVSAHR
jgi:hypothetical protein